MPTAPDVIASYFTLAGDTQLAFRGGDEVSPFDLRDRIEAAARAGYTGMGFLDTDLRVWGEKYPPAEVARLLDANGIKNVEVEELWSWFTDGESRRKSDRSRADLLRWAEALGALHIKTGTDLSGAPTSHERLVEELRVLAGQAADVGTRIALEPMPPATLKTPAEVLSVVSDAGAPNVGLLLDSWHVARADVAFGSLADLPGDRIFAVELRDAATDPVGGDLIVDGLDFSQAPGDGDLDIASYVRAIRSTGYDGPWGVEIFSIANRARSLDDAARINFQATAAAVREIERLA